MKATKEQMKQEALVRMNILKLYPNVLHDFMIEDKLNFSAYGRGILYWLTDEMRELVKDFEATYGFLVYHVIDDQTEIGRLFTLLYISTEKEEWPTDQQDLRDGCPMAYVINCDCDAFSEFGTVGVKPIYGGVVRTA